MFNDDRIRVTHVGSLARPPELQEYLRAYENGDALDEAAFEECLRRSVADVVRKQHEIGIDVVSDGEFGKTQTWAWYIRDRLAGFEERPLPPSDLVGPRDPSRLGEDRRAYADFYADYFRRNPSPPASASTACPSASAPSPTPGRRRCSATSAT